MPWPLGQTPFTPDTITGISSNSQLLCVSMGRVLTEPLLLPLLKGAGWGEVGTVHPGPRIPRAECVPGCIPEHNRRGKEPFPCRLWLRAELETQWSRPGRWVHPSVRP